MRLAATCSSALSAVAFATIPAVVAGLTLAGASAVARPVRQRLPQGRDRASGAEGLKITVLILGVVAILLGILFENQNIAFMVGFGLLHRRQL